MVAAMKRDMLVSVCLLALATASDAVAVRTSFEDGAAVVVKADPLLGKGASVTLATGVPFLGIGEVAWGFGDRFTLGAIAGVTPTVVGAGVRPRASLFEWSQDRIELVAPLLYYPETSDGAPWMLTRPMLNWSHVLDNGVRYGVGAGIVAATAVGRNASQRPYAGASGNAHDFGWWNAVGGHFSLPIGHDVVVFTEAAAILSGFRFAGSDWIGGPPFTLSLGATTHLL